MTDSSQSKADIVDFDFIFMKQLYFPSCFRYQFNSIQDYLYSAFYDTIVAKQLHRKLSFLKKIYIVETQYN